MLRKLRTVAFFGLLLASLGMLSCVREKLITADDIHSQIRSAISLVSESDLLIDLLCANRLTRSFARGHASSLQDEASESAEELKKGRPESGTELALHECQTQLEELNRELSVIRAGIAHSDDLSQEKTKLAEIRTHLEHAASSL